MWDEIIITNGQCQFPLFDYNEICDLNHVNQLMQNLCWIMLNSSFFHTFTRYHEAGGSLIKIGDH